MAKSNKHADTFSFNYTWCTCKWVFFTMLSFLRTDHEKGCCFDQWPIDQCETAKQSGECGESQIANNCLKTCGWCCDSVDNIVDPGKKSRFDIHRHMYCLNGLWMPDNFF